MKRILFIQPSIENYRIDFYNKLSKKYLINLISSKVNQKNEKLKDDIIIKRFIPLKILFLEFQLFNFFILRKYDIIILTGNLKIISNWVIFFLNIFYKKKIVWLGHILTKRHNLLKSILLNINFKNIDCILCYNDLEKKFLNFYYKNVKSISLDNGLKSFEFHKDDVKNKDLEFLSLIFIGNISNKVFIEKALECFYNLPFRININFVTNLKFFSKIEKKLKDIKSHNNLFSYKLYDEIYDNAKLKEIFFNSNFFFYPGKVGLSLTHSFQFCTPAILQKKRYYHMPEYILFKDRINGVAFKDYDDLKQTFSIANQYLSHRKNYFKLCFDSSKISKKYNTDKMVLNFNKVIINL